MALRRRKNAQRRDSDRNCIMNNGGFDREKTYIKHFCHSEGRSNLFLVECKQFNPPPFSPPFLISIHKILQRSFFFKESLASICNYILYCPRCCFFCRALRPVKIKIDVVSICILRWILLKGEGGS